MELILAFDNAILNFVQFLRCDFLDFLMPIYSALGNAGLVWIVLAIALLCFKKTRRTGCVMALSLILCLLVGNMALKPLIARVRPYVANNFVGLLVPPLSDFSFPSGHTFSAFAAACSIAFYHKKSGAAAILAAVIMAFSRLYLYVHYPTDVIFGVLLGVFAAFVSRYAVDKIFVRINSKDGAI